MILADSWSIAKESPNCSCILMDGPSFTDFIIWGDLAVYLSRHTIPSLQQWEMSTPLKKIIYLIRGQILSASLSCQTIMIQLRACIF
jgi:hypothetical protein